MRRAVVSARATAAMLAVLIGGCFHGATMAHGKPVVVRMATAGEFDDLQESAGAACPIDGDLAPELRRPIEDFAYAQLVDHAAGGPTPRIDIIQQPLWKVGELKVTKSLEGVGGRVSRYCTHVIESADKVTVAVQLLSDYDVQQ